MQAFVVERISPARTKSLCVNEENLEPLQDLFSHVDIIDTKCGVAIGIHHEIISAKLVRKRADTCLRFPYIFLQNSITLLKSEAIWLK